MCSKLANCKSCSLNLNCQWDQNQSECHALPGEISIHMNTHLFFFFFKASVLTRAREADYQYLAVKDLEIGDKKRDKYMFCLPYVAHKGLEPS